MISADTSGVVFDTRSKMVMWQGGTTERMKEKVRHLTWSALLQIGLTWSLNPPQILCRIERFLILLRNTSCLCCWIYG